MINKDFFKPTDISNNTTFKSVLAMITGDSELNTLTRDQLERYDLMIECEICGDKYNSTIYNTVEKCEHTFCDGCWFDFLSVKIKKALCKNQNCFWISVRHLA